MITAYICLFSILFLTLSLNLILLALLSSMINTVNPSHGGLAGAVVKPGRPA